MPPTWDTDEGLDADVTAMSADRRNDSRLLCCFCGGASMSGEYVELMLRIEDNPRTRQFFGAHRACLAERLAPRFRLELEPDGAAEFDDWRAAMNEIAARVLTPPRPGKHDWDGLSADLDHAVFEVPGLSVVNATLGDDRQSYDLEWHPSDAHTPSLEAIHRDVLAVISYLSGGVTAVHQGERSDSVVYNMLLDSWYRVQFRIVGPALRDVLAALAESRATVAKYRAAAAESSNSTTASHRQRRDHHPTGDPAGAGDAVAGVLEP
jgi:hypothetical protein